LRRLLLIACALMFATAAQAVAPSADAPGVKDEPGLKRFGGSVLVNRTDVAFDAVALVTGRLSADGRTAATQAFEGRHTRLVYLAPPTAGPLELSRNYRNAIVEGGGQILFECAGAACGGGASAGAGLQPRIFPKEKVGGEVWWTKCTLGYPDTTPFNAPILDVRYFVAKLGGSATRYVSVLSYTINSPYDCAGFDRRNAVVVQVVDPKDMGDSMVLVKASAMQTAIASQGHVALYGVYFDTGQAVVKPESAPTLGEIATLLKGQPKLNVFVVGHTDNTGDHAANLALSKARAAAVVQALTTRYGLAAARLRAEGVGMLAPAATNDTADGRGRNRRVELVKAN
jgi:outer membrane protein OmpA-like peptidoglycan-associated protein